MAAMQKTINVPARKIKQLQELVGAYNLRWVFNPYPIHPHNPNGEWRAGVDYGNVSMDKASDFDAQWKALNTPVIESYKKYSIIEKLTIWVKQYLR